YRLLGTATAASGRLRFTPALGPGGKRQVVAELTRNGAPVRKLVVATYVAAAPPKLTRPAGLRVSRKGAALVVRWRPVAGAAVYAVTFVAKGARTMSVVRGTAARLKVTAAGTVLVGALGANGKPGPLARAAVKAAPRQTPTRSGRSSRRRSR